MVICIILVMSICPYRAFSADESLVVTEAGNVVIGATYTPERLTVVNSGKNGITFGVRGIYPSVTANGTNYYKQMEVGEPMYNIPQGIVDNGYRIGLAVQGYVLSDDFKGTLNTQIGAWIRAGAFLDKPTGTINSSCALRIDNIDGANVKILDKYAIYQTSTTAKNHFAGPLCVGITDPGVYKMYVNGDMYATRIRTSIASGTWQDQVFEEDYKLLPLFDVEEFVKKNKHLPEVPSAAELEKKGIDTAEMLSIHMKKIEELTLYLIDLKKENEELKARIERIESQIRK